MLKFAISDLKKLQQAPGTQQFQSRLSILYKQQTKKSIPSSILHFLLSLYSFCTYSQFSLQQKCQLLNFFLQQIYLIPKLSTHKSQFMHEYKNKINKQLGSRTPDKMHVYFSYQQIQKIISLFQREVVDCYEMWEFVLDQREEFNLETKQFQPIPLVKQFKIVQGQVVAQPQNIATLKQFVGQRVVKQQKKDAPKKK